MRIAFSARYLPAEGSTIHMYTLASGLTRAGHEVHLVSAGTPHDKAAEALLARALQSGLIHHTVPFPLYPKFSATGKAAQLASYAHALPVALGELSQIDPDIVHVHYPVTSFVGRIHQIRSPTPVVVTHHATGIPRHPLSRRGDMAIAISEDLRIELTTRHGYDPSRVRTVLNGVDEAVFGPPTQQERTSQRAQLGVDEDVVLLGFMGRLTSAKGMDVLLDAVRPYLGPHVRLLVAGQPATGKGAVSVPHAMRRWVIEMPFQQDPRPLYAALDLLVHPSRFEGFPLVPLEAMMMGTPVIRSRTGGAQVQVLDGLNGYIVPVGSSHALAAALEKFLGLSPAERQSMGASAADHAISHFSSTAMVRRTLDVYDEARSVRGRAKTR
ncbi:glycosyltransferase family 4 protein [Ornithinimicrobium sediminis]|uniref:glycosyltransferase family 4 protein n=1 Tax=Ornithinimicrobium sediminis TaxID=2904603 RepID=UPI0022B81A07|nr:glycosyltransferase family 4 protein [Ornithinimicrobium sediminis]